MANKFKFSVIIPTYNRAIVLDRSLDSLVKQTFKDFEVIVCDDGSTDHTREVVTKYYGILDIKYLVSDNWGGPAKPRNIGIKMARGEWICFLDSDDWWERNKLEVCLKYINDYDFLCHSVKIEGTKRSKIIRASFQVGKVFEDLLVKGNSIVTSSVCIKKAILFEIGGFVEDKAFIAVEDFDLWLKVAEKGYRFKIIEDVLGFYSVGNGNISMTEKQIEKINTIYDYHINNYKLNSLLLKKVIGIKKYHTGRLHHEAFQYSKAVLDYKKAVQLGSASIKLKSLLHMVFAVFGIKVKVY
ncbi:glycosyltransferase family 2 protein [Rubrolithibacter danxiaensis]|uniref:glycosyltransferase family 2 protein n=1 Tax=Rubrolithibacter danxiaensis TaxID=3390805 RepID=UPI003BF78701